MMVVMGVVGEVEAEPWEEAMVATERMDLLEEQEDEVPALTLDCLEARSSVLFLEGEGGDTMAMLVVAATEESL